MDGVEAEKVLQEQKEKDEVAAELADLKGSEEENSEKEMYGEDEEEAPQVGKRRAHPDTETPELENINARGLKRQKRMIFSSYYRGTFFGKSSSSVLYELCVQLNKETRDMLWWRVVGVTDRILHAKIDDEERNAEIASCIKEVYRLVPDNSANF
jgi:cell division control protein 45